MQSLSEVYNNLSKEYKLEWIDDKKQGFYVYISNGRNVKVLYTGTTISGKVFDSNKWSDMPQARKDF